MRGLGITNNGTLLSSNVSILTANSSFNFTQGTNSEVVTLNLNTTGVTAGTYNNVVVNIYGIITSASNIGYLTNNQTITLSGDVTGSGTTAITTTLATVNSTPGTFSVVVVNSKGLISVGNNLVATGDVSGTASGASITLTLAATGISAGTYQNLVVNTKGLVVSGTSVITTAGTYNQVVINSTGQVISGTFASSSTGALAVTLTGAVTATGTSSGGTLNLPTTFASNGTFLGNLTIVGSLTAGYIDNSIIGSTTPVAGTFTNLAATTQTIVGSGTDGTLFEDNYSTAYLGDILTAKPFFAILRTTGQVGSVNQTNYNSAPTFRNTLDDGSGNFIVPGNATIGTMTVGVITATSGLTGPSGQKYFFGPPGTFNNFVISSTGSVAGSFVNYGTSGTNSLASISITATGVVTGTTTGSNGIYSLPLVFSSSPSFTGTLVASSMSVVSANFTGILTGPNTTSLNDSSLNVATTSFVKGQNYLFANGSAGTFNNFVISSNGSVIPSYTTYGTGGAGIVSVSISATGAATGTTTGSNGTYSLPLTLASSGVVSGTYTKYVVNSYGLITTGMSLASSDISSSLGYTPAQFINGNATINFGSPGTSTTSVAVSATAINSLTYPMVYVSGTSSTSSNGTLAHSQADLFFSLSVTSITPGTGFTISAYSRSGTLTGQYIIQYLAFIPPIALSFINPVANYETPPSTSFTYAGPVTVSSGGTLAVPTGYVMYVT